MLSVRCEIKDSVYRKAIKSFNGHLENWSLPDIFLLQLSFKDTFQTKFIT